MAEKKSYHWKIIVVIFHLDIHEKRWNKNARWFAQQIF